MDVLFPVQKILFGNKVVATYNCDEAKTNKYTEKLPLEPHKKEPLALKFFKSVLIQNLIRILTN
jgi:hypothetical protein